MCLQFHNAVNACLQVTLPFLFYFILLCDIKNGSRVIVCFHSFAVWVLTTWDIDQFFFKRYFVMQPKWQSTVERCSETVKLAIISRKI
jgi:hypothetical protein